MSHGRSTRWLTLIGAAALLGALAILPAFGSNHEDALRLHLGADTRRFFDPGTSTEQLLTSSSKGCEIDPTAGSLVTLSTMTGANKPGLVGTSIGVKSSGSNANGTPCSQITGPSETLVLIKGANPARDWRRLRLDLELKGNAWTFLTVKKGTQSRTFQLVTGSSIATYNAANTPALTPAAGPPYMASSSVSAPNAACASPSDSGPDSGPNDNCQWSIDPGMAFDRVEITTSVGSASLEGGGDFGPGTANDSLFFYNKGPVATNDAYSVDQGSTLTVGAPGVLANDSDPDGDPLTAVRLTAPSNGSVTLNSNGSLSYTPASGFYGTDSFTYAASDGSSQSSPATVTITVNRVICPGNTITVADGAITGSFTFLTAGAQCKPFAAQAVQADGTILFQPTGGSKVNYRATLRLSPKTAPAPSGTFGLLLEYDPTGGNTFRAVPWCIDPQFDGSGALTSATIPAGESWCIGSAYTTPVAGSSPQKLSTDWQLYGYDDPKFQ